MPSPSIAKIVAAAYGYQTDSSGTSQTINLYRYAPSAEPPTVHIATIAFDGEIIPRIGYTRADHECAMAIRATMPVK